MYYYILKHILLFLTLNEMMNYNISSNLFGENNTIRWGWGGAENLVNWPE